MTKEVRAALKTLVEDNVGEMHDWFRRQWKSDDGGKVAANLLSRLIEFAAPKLQRTDTPPADAELLAKSVEQMTDAELDAVAGSWKDPNSAMRAYDTLISGITPVCRRVQDEMLRRMSHEERDETEKNLLLAMDGDLDEYHRARCRPATAADFGLAEPEPPRPAALPDPAPRPAIPVRLPDLVPVEPVAVSFSPPAEPLEGEFIRDVQSVMTASAQREYQRSERARRERGTDDEAAQADLAERRREKFERYDAERAEWQARYDAEAERIAERLGCAVCNVAPIAVLLTVGQPPPQPVWI